MKNLPIAATLVVALAVAAMIGLGLWQLDRREQKRALIASFTRNATLPETALSPAPVPDASLFRRVRATCTTPAAPRRSAGRSDAGASGYRFLVTCREGFVVDLGVAGDPRLTPAWGGGAVNGVLTRPPDSTSFIQRLFGARPQPVAMIVPPRPLAAGLAASRTPDPANVPDNHLAYAVQWFAFAAMALVIYGFALRRRGR
ncbi:SURF1 family protein [Sphingomonas sp.]|uniref:SURF1 family protein n=1 Tax=Sphingomonas sp. TaxID=28214 RepID=UPI002B7B124B|nr:SURF1 family protein [Sphingomonas sp.]HTG39330.1 SURF1 family protein [Sphingomonas sp.]